jgi:hypothetical protein
MRPYPNKLTYLTVGSTVSLSVISLPAQAQTTGTAADLLPLDAQAVTVDTVPDSLKNVAPPVSTSLRPEVTYRPALLQTVAHQINHGPRPSEERVDTPDIGDLIDLSFVEQFIDDNGNVDLPLGITVYEAMGTTSIGFGGDFR